MRVLPLILFVGVILFPFAASAGNLGNFSVGLYNGLKGPVVGDQSTYVGAQGCSGMGCHEQQYLDWNQTAHAHMAGYLGDLYGNGTIYYWVHNSSDPSRIYTEDYFVARCAKCHTTGWDADTQTWPEKDTDPAKFLNVQCEVCHGANTMSLPSDQRINYSTDVCAQCHNQPADLALSAHNNSLTDLLASDHAADSCLQCHSVQAFLGKDVHLNTTGLEAITCVLCHDTHSSENEYQLRFENSTEMCGQCHTGYHPTYESFTTGPHSKAGLECASCHGQGTRLFHGQESTWFNHTFWIYNTFYPYNQTDPIVCSSCHAQSWATIQLGLIQGLTEETISNASQAITEAENAVNAANQTSGVNMTKVNEASEMVDAANSYLTQIQHEGSKGFHNPEQSYTLLIDATRLANAANALAQEARAEALGTQASNLYLYLGGGIVVGLVIGALIIYLIKRRPS